MISKIGNGSWLKENYDRVALIAVLALVLASTVAIFFFTDAAKLSMEIKSTGGASSAGKTVASANTSVVARLTTYLSSPVHVASEDRRLFVGPMRVACVQKAEPIAYDATNCFFCLASQPNPGDENKRDSDGDGIPDKWEKKYGLNPLDPSDATSDLDNDGFDNKDEYIAETVPSDTSSKPQAISKVRAKEIKIEPFKLRFLGVNKLPSGENSYQLNARTLDRTYFATNGGVVEGWRVLELDSRDTKRTALVLQLGERKLRLVQNEVINDDSFSAKLLSLIEKPRREVVVSRGKTATLAGVDYYVVDITRESVVIRDTSTGRETTVKLVTREEEDSHSSDSVMPSEINRRSGSRGDERSIFDEFPKR